MWYTPLGTVSSPSDPVCLHNGPQSPMITGSEAAAMAGAAVPTMIAGTVQAAAASTVRRFGRNAYEPDASSLTSSSLDRCPADIGTTILHALCCVQDRLFLA